MKDMAFSLAPLCSARIAPFVLKKKKRLGSSSLQSLSFFWNFCLNSCSPGFICHISYLGIGTNLYSSGVIPVMSTCHPITPHTPVYFLHNSSHKLCSVSWAIVTVFWSSQKASSMRVRISNCSGTFVEYTNGRVILRNSSGWVHVGISSYLQWKVNFV